VSDHIPDVTKMIGETPRTDLMEQHAPVGLRRNAAFEQASGLCRQLERELNAANQISKKYEDRYFECLERIKRLIAERDTARRQADQNWKLREEFTELLGTDDVKRGVAVVREMKQRIKRLEEAGDRTARWCDDEEAVENWHQAKEAKP
jgi:hypothetical protein